MVTAKAYGDEISFSIGSHHHNCSNTMTYGRKHGEYAEKCVLTPGEYTLKCKDSHGDGWHKGFIEIQGHKYCEDFTEGSEKTEQVIITGIDMDFYVGFCLIILK